VAWKRDGKLALLRAHFRGSLPSLPDYLRFAIKPPQGESEPPSSGRPLRTAADPWLPRRLRHPLPPADDPATLLAKQRRLARRTGKSGREGRGEGGKAETERGWTLFRSTGRRRGT